ncbi:glucosyltransferase [Dimargaris verticillata]|uniref:Dol-P-Glc:Glc(2)Man(9)GlcNAc(2)-PP-Dol alpha-1,2-glucosyltransferase n=1 Tax=Dimargaris verticillata TaxID=2761393 RepID=A0A9W8BAG0_9FUNG|nr:glucosyltransferase [Dimargaris verticillata]
MATWTTAVAWAAFLAATSWLAVTVNQVVPQPYMDEVFHVAQAQAYCRGHYWAWDPMLTTPPGLYIWSNLVFQLMHLATGQPIKSLCTVANLRYSNAALVPLLLGIVAAILRHHQQGKQQRRLYIEALAITAFPVLYFVSVLYYTDTGSTLLVLTGYYLALKRWHRLSGLMCLLSLTFRQTNVVWTVLIAYTGALQEFAHLPIDAAARDHICTVKAGQLDTLAHGLGHIWQTAKTLCPHLGQLLPSLLPYFTVGMAFLGFLLWNKGIVLGDRSHHLAGFHIPQFYYCAMILLGFLAPVVLRLNHPVRFMTAVIKFLQNGWQVAGCLAITAGMGYSIYQFTYEHPFLLSDNRHYSFYLWKDLYRRHTSVRYLMIPGYCFAVWLLARTLASRQTLTWCLVYVGCIALTLIPSPLLEFRYFILPYYFLRLQLGRPRQHRVTYEFALFALANFITLYIFLYKPFTWAQAPHAWQRFMW